MMGTIWQTTQSQYNAVVVLKFIEPNSGTFRWTAACVLGRGGKLLSSVVATATGWIPARGALGRNNDE